MIELTQIQVEFYLFDQSNRLSIVKMIGIIVPSLITYYSVAIYSLDLHDNLNNNVKGKVPK